jgi:hypothetical protein
MLSLAKPGDTEFSHTAGGTVNWFHQFREHFNLQFFIENI